MFLLQALRQREIDRFLQSLQRGHFGGPEFLQAFDHALDQDFRRGGAGGDADARFALQPLGVDIGLYGRLWGYLASPCLY